MKVPQIKPWVGDDEYKAIESCFTDNWITEGPKTKEFEKKLLKLIGSKYGVFAPNGTLGLYLGLRAIGIEPGDEVIVPDFTFIASATSVEMTGATPIFVDVNKKNFQIDLKGASSLVTKRTRAIMPVHMYGTIADMDQVTKFAKKHDLKVIEDAAQAISVHRNGKHAGTFGDVAMFSFFADKTITTSEGAFVVTNDKKTYENLLYLRNQGRLNRGSFIHPKIGYNFRTTDIHSAIGLVQLGKLKEIVKRKMKILSLYQKLLKDVPNITFFEPDDDSEWVPFRVPILVKDAHDLMEYLSEHDISPRSFFYPLHQQPPFSKTKVNKRKIGRRPQRDSQFPNTIYGYEHGVCLPVFPTLTVEQIEYVCSTIKDYYSKRGNLFYEYYDVLFAEKDYSKETDMVFSLSEQYGAGRPSKLLEIGCGTGNHTISILKKNNLQVVAIDTDEKMVDIAKRKTKGLTNQKSKILHTSVEELGEKGFDLVLALFNVISYIPDEDKLVSFMKSISNRLLPGGVFVFDCWNGVAAIADPPKAKNTNVKKNGEVVDCKLTSETDLFNQKTVLNYKLKITRKGKVTREGEFSFDQTLWTPMQIISAVKSAGMEVVVNSPFMQPGKSATEKDWKIMFCVRKPN